MAERTCIIDGCDSTQANRRGWCWKHYSRWRKHGDPHQKWSRTPASLQECSIDGCDSPQVSRFGLCGMHRERQRRHGDPLWEPPTWEERFWAQVDVRGRGDCWEWQGSRSHGYGGYAGQRAHRVSLEFKLGRPLRDGAFACHHCDNPPCVNPDHLYEGDYVTNSTDAYRRGRWTPPTMSGADHPNALDITPAVVERVRKMRSDGALQREIAEAVGTSRHVVAQILRGTHWSVR